MAFRLHAARAAAAAILLVAAWPTAAHASDGPLRPIDPREAKAFFERYVELAQQQDAALADLYAEDARIRARQRLPNGANRIIDLSGAQYRQLIRQTYSGTASGRDRSEYSDVIIESTGEHVRIRAKRHAVRKCYWDVNYNLVIARRADGRLRVVEENLDTHPQAHC